MPPNNPNTDVATRHRPSDGWAMARIWIAGTVGAMLAGCSRILDFWSLGGTGRGFFELTQAMLFLGLAGFILGLLIAGGISLWRLDLPRIASSIIAIIIIPVCFLIVAKVPLFDPWLWYAIHNSSRFEAVARRHPSPNGPKYAEIEVRDVSTGFAGIDPNHFVALVYDESDAIGLKASERSGIWQTRTELGLPLPKGRRLWGHLFRVDIFG
jgi:hypothetical protein